MRFLRGLLLAFLVVGPVVGAPREAVYPDNPNLAEEAIFVSGSGLSRLEYGGMEPSWHQLEGVFPLEPVVTGPLVLVGSPVGIFALDTQSGNMRWHLPSPHTLNTPTVIGTTAYVGGEDGSLRAVDLKNGDVHWQKALNGSLYSPAISEGDLVAGSSAGELWGISSKDGHEQWHDKIGKELVVRPIAGTDGPVYISTVDGTILAIAPETGRVQWKTQLTTAASTAVFENRLLLGQINGLVSAYNRYTGTKIWEYELGGPTSSPVRILDGFVVAISDDGNSVLLNPEDGSLVERIESPPEEPPPTPAESTESPELVVKGPGMPWRATDM